MFSVFRNFTARNIPQKLNFGRFDIKTTEHQKMVKAILANSDNCGDTICGDPVEVKNIINNKHTDIDNSSFNKLETGNPEFCCQFYNFEKCNDCHFDK